MKNSIILLSLLSLASCKTANSSNSTLKKAYQQDFFIGTALNLKHIHNEDKKGVYIVKKEFSSVVAENCMKSMFLQPEENVFFFDDADKFVAFGQQNKMFIIGHTLIWHSQAPDWFFTDKEGKDVSAEVLKQRMKKHIQTVVSRYKGKVKGWDVVNEAIMEDGSYRKSKFYEIIGEDFIPLAFQWAHEADPDAELYYNDYNEWHPGKVERLISLINSFKAQNIRIDGIGMQAHVGLDYPSIEEYEKAIVAYANAGVKVSVTEFEISALPSPHKISSNISDTQAYQKELNPYSDGVLPIEVQKKWENRYNDFFTLFLKHKDKMKRVTFWGVTDADSWKNDFPIVGRTDYPLLFDRKYQEKPIVKELIQLAEKK
ncbi:endo-1,4-beta-xylanase [Soonwooa sp.]|uniref:endo-1,4-beta-xylanase n=1 Tax=Soonwooa sp. TaxID=1938592 RepID=UPI00262A0548|nr:endo-1,4-beta-xylanase [Soonwooa sp.]